MATFQVLNCCDIYGYIYIVYISDQLKTKLINDICFDISIVFVPLVSNILQFIGLLNKNHFLFIPYIITSIVYTSGNTIATILLIANNYSINEIKNLIFVSIFIELFSAYCILTNILLFMKLSKIYKFNYLIVEYVKYSKIDENDDILKIKPNFRIGYFSSLPVTEVCK